MILLLGCKFYFWIYIKPCFRKSKQSLALYFDIFILLFSNFIYRVFSTRGCIKMMEDELSMSSRTNPSAGMASFAILLQVTANKVRQLTSAKLYVWYVTQIRRAVHSSHQYFDEVTNQITNFKSPIFLLQVTKMCCIIHLRLWVWNVILC